MTYQEKCRIRAHMLLDAANGVEFQEWNSCTDSWRDVEEPNFNYSPGHYRRKPKLVRHEAVVAWLQFNTPEEEVYAAIFDNDAQLDSWLSRNPRALLKREIVFVEVEE